MKRKIEIFEMIGVLLVSIFAGVVLVLMITDDLHGSIKTMGIIAMFSSLTWGIIHVIHLLTRMSKLKYDFDKRIAYVFSSLFRNPVISRHPKVAKESLDKLKEWIDTDHATDCEKKLNARRGISYIHEGIFH